MLQVQIEGVSISQEFTEFDRSQTGHYGVWIKSHSFGSLEIKVTNVIGINKFTFFSFLFKKYLF